MARGDLLAGEGQVRPRHRVVGGVRLQTGIRPVLRGEGLSVFPSFIWSVAYIVSLYQDLSVKLLISFEYDCMRQKLIYEDLRNKMQCPSLYLHTW